MMRFSMLAAVLAALTVVPSSSSVTSYYTSTPLGSFTPVAMNNNGLVVGNGGTGGIAWTEAGGIRSLPGVPNDVGDDGVVVGMTLVGPPHAFAWSATNGTTDLGPGYARAVAGGLVVGSDLRHPIVWTPEGAIDLFGYSADTGAATGVGASGRVVGYGETPDQTWYLFTWTRADGLSVLADIGFAVSPPSVWVNDRGEVAGNEAGGGFYWSPDAGLVDVGDLIPNGSTHVNGIGADGTVFGSSLVGWDGMPLVHPFTWSLGHGMTDLGTLGGKRGFASGVGSDGTVGGWTMITDSITSHAFVWTNQLGMLDLGFGPSESSMVYAVNDRGWLVGTSGGQAYLWRPRTDAPPVIAVPASVTAEATSADGATVTFTATAVDDVDASPAIACTPPSGSVFPLGTTQVSCSATDSAGNTSAGVFSVYVVDTTPPALTLLPASVDATSPAGAAVAFTALATDHVDSAPSLVCTPASGSTFPMGDTIVSCVGRDAAGNVSTGSVTVHVRGAVEQHALLTTRVQALDARFGTANSLLVKLDAGHLDAFVHAVEAQSGKSIPTAEAADLIARAQRIERLLG